MRLRPVPAARSIRPVGGRTAVLAIGVLTLAALTACTGSDDDPATAMGSDGPACVTDLSASRANVELPSTFAAVTETFLRPGAAVLQVGQEPRVLGRNPGLTAALDGSRVWAVVPDGFLVQLDRDRDGPTELAVVADDGQLLSTGPRLEQVERVQVVRGQVRVSGEPVGGTIEAYDLESGRKVAVGPKNLASRPDVAASPALVLSDEADVEAVLPFDGEERLDVADLGDGDVTGVKVAAGTTDRVVLRADGTDASGPGRFWTWSPGEPPRELAPAAAETLEDAASVGLCDDFAYLVADGELRVVDLADAAARVVSRVAFVDSDEAGSHEVVAVRGGVLVTDLSGDDAANRYSWYAEPDGGGEGRTP